MTVTVRRILATCPIWGESNPAGASHATTVRMLRRKQRESVVEICMPDSFHDNRFRAVWKVGRLVFLHGHHEMCAMSDEVARGCFLGVQRIDSDHVVGDVDRIESAVSIRISLVFKPTSTWPITTLLSWSIAESKSGRARRRSQLRGRPFRRR